MYLLAMYVTFLVVVTRDYSAQEEATRELFAACPRYAGINIQKSVEFSSDIAPNLGILALLGFPFIVLLVHVVSGPGVSSLCCAGLLAGATYYLVDMQRKRDILSRIIGAGFEDNKWGFAQILSIFIWLPVCVNIGGVLFKVSQGWVTRQDSDNHY
jgi:hypothetical protein